MTTTERREPRTTEPNLFQFTDGSLLFSLELKSLCVLHLTELPFLAVPAMQEVKTANAQLHSLDFLERIAITHSQKKKTIRLLLIFPFYKFLLTRHDTRRQHRSQNPESQLCVRAFRRTVRN